MHRTWCQLGELLKFKHDFAGFVDLEWIETSERASNEKFGIGVQGV